MKLLNNPGLLNLERSVSPWLDRLEQYYYLNRSTVSSRLYIVIKSFEYLLNEKDSDIVRTLTSKVADMGKLYGVNTPTDYRLSKSMLSDDSEETWIFDSEHYGVFQAPVEAIKYKPIKIINIGNTDLNVRLGSLSSNTKGVFVLNVSALMLQYKYYRKTHGDVGVGKYVDQYLLPRLLKDFLHQSIINNIQKYAITYNILNPKIIPHDRFGSKTAVTAMTEYIQSTVEVINSSNLQVSDILGNVRMWDNLSAYDLYRKPFPPYPVYDTYRAINKIRLYKVACSLTDNPSVVNKNKSYYRRLYREEVLPYQSLIHENLKDIKP